MLMYLYELMFLMGLISFSLKRKHLLLMLLSLEYLVVVLFIMLLSCLIIFDNEMFLLMVFLTLSVCEGALGLSLLISMIRTHGNDYVLGFTLLW